MGGETDQFHPDLVHGDHRVDPPRTPEQGHELTEDLVDHRIQFPKNLRATYERKPFLLYVAPGACHAPHQAPPSYIDQLGELDDTLVILMSDNGGSAEGGPKGSFNEAFFFTSTRHPGRRSSPGGPVVRWVGAWRSRRQAAGGRYRTGEARCGSVGWS